MAAPVQQAAHVGGPLMLPQDSAGRWDIMLTYWGTLHRDGQQEWGPVLVFAIWALVQPSTAGLPVLPRSGIWEGVLQSWLQAELGARSHVSVPSPAHAMASWSMAYCLQQETTYPMFPQYFATP